MIEKGAAKLSLADIEAFLLGRGIAKFKLPERLGIVAACPTSAAGRILRRDLRRAIADQIADEDKASPAQAAG